MNYICIFFGCVFLLGGVLFAESNLYTHLKLWKELSKEEQSKLKIKSLCKNIGSIIAVCGIIFFIKGMFAVMSNQIFTIIMIVWLVLAGFDVLYIEKSKRYKKQ